MRANKRFTFPLARSRAILLILFVATLIVLPAAAASPPDSVPFEYYSGIVIADVYLEGTGPFPFIVDTDSSPSAIDVGLARTLGLPLGHAFPEGTFPVILHDISLGRTSLSPLSAIAVDLEPLRSRVDRPIYGILGKSFFRSHTITLDYRCKKITVGDRPRANPLASLHVRYVGPEVISHDVWVGSHRVTATIDTGNTSALFVTKRGIQLLNLEEAAEDGQPSVRYEYPGQRAAEHVLHDTRGTVNDVRIGTRNLGRVAALFSPGLAHEKFDIDIGNGIFQNYLVTFNLTAGILNLERASSSCPD